MAGKKQSRLKSVNKNKVTTFDSGTGEIIQSIQESTYKIETEPGFVKWYLEDIGKIRDYSKGEIEILSQLLKRMDYTNTVLLPSGIKQDMADELKIYSQNWINVCVNSMTKKGLLIKKKTGVYVVNPDLFAKGTWKDIREIRFEITYNKDGRTVKTETE